MTLEGKSSQATGYGRRMIKNDNNQTVMIVEIRP